MDWQMVGRNMGVLLGGGEYDDELEPVPDANAYRHRERHDLEPLGVRIYEAAEERLRRRRRP